MVRTDVDAATSAQRFMGGHIRAGISPKTAVELALDLHSETNEALTRRIREYPIQASLLVFPIKATFAPYVLGGGGWYTTKFETLVGDETVASESERKFGWHAGFGAELRLGRHAGAHADYRYTFLRFGGDDDDTIRDEGFSRFLPSYQGSMWTAGLTVYF